MPFHERPVTQVFEIISYYFVQKIEQIFEPQSIKNFHGNMVIDHGNMVISH